MVRPRGRMKHKRNLDQFFTNPDVAAWCASIAKKYASPNSIIEPSAGAGTLVDAAKKAFPKIPIRAYDIDPKRSDIMEADFLASSISPQEPKTALVFANPPFGKRSALAIKFFNRAAELADILAFCNYSQDSLSRRS